MSENDKSLRLLKVAKELNIGTATITDYLAAKGFQIENKPTAKVSEAMYGVLLKEFQGDKNTKEEAKQIAIGKIRKEDAAAAPEVKIHRPAAYEEDGKEVLIKNADVGNHSGLKNPVSAPHFQNNRGGAGVLEAEPSKAEPNKAEPSKAEPQKIVQHAITTANLVPTSSVAPVPSTPTSTAPVSASASPVSSAPVASAPVSTSATHENSASETALATPASAALNGNAVSTNAVLEQSNQAERKAKIEEQALNANQPALNESQSDSSQSQVPQNQHLNEQHTAGSHEQPATTLTDTNPSSRASTAGDAVKSDDKVTLDDATTTGAPHLTIVGKIDLDSFKPKPKRGPMEQMGSRQVRNEDRTVHATAPGVSSKSSHASVPTHNTSPAVRPVTTAPQNSPVAQPSATSSALPNGSTPITSSPSVAATAIATPTAPAPSSAPTVDQPEPPASEEDKAADKEKINTNFQKLSGPSIIGRIELPVQRRSQPVATSGSSLDQARKKRKRKDAQPHTGSAAGNQTSTSHSGPGFGGPGRPSGSGGNIAPTNDPRRSENRPAGQRGPFNSNPSIRRDDRVKTPHVEPTEKEIQDQIKATLARLSGAGKSGKFAQRAKFRRQKRDDSASVREEDQLDRQAQSKILKVTEFVTANELSKLMDVPVNQVISTCMSLGMFVSINQRLDAETLTIVAEEFGYKIDFVSAETEVLVEEEEDDEETLVPRAPIVTVMGHVDHGKTSLLDYIRNTNVIGGEAGGITQHIGAYEVALKGGKKITFLDTPGHEAFTAMRARGAQSTDIVIIVIAGDDAVMPQTVEAINHAQAASVPMVFAFNKMDKPGANADKIREQLAQMNILVEEWGGKYQTQEVSAKKGQNVDLLLEKVLLEAELLDLKANPNKRAVGTVVEAALDKGRGIVTTILVQAGTLRIGDPILAGCYSGRVKAMFNERQQKVAEAGPSAPVLVLGMQGAPQAGDKFLSMESEPEAREIANKRLQLQREQGIRTQKHITLDEIGRRLAIGNFKELNIIVKGDVDGSIEALSDSLLKLSTAEIQVNVLHKSVGQISESDVLLASASDAIIIGFQVRPSGSARKLAEAEQIDIRLYSIIYDAIGEIKSAMEGMLAPVFEEKIVCNVEVREVFKITKVGTIAGCYVLDGKITRNTSVRIVRDGVVIHSGSLESLKRFKDDVKEVATGYECGLNIRGFNDIEVGDIIEGYEQVEVKRKL